jgi:catechol 2,3-dioxygenase-like lactoylglutathione lyase family enzyme
VLREAPFVGFVPVRDLAVARRFYEGVLGLSVLHEDAFGVELDAGGTVLRLSAVNDLTPAPFTVAGWRVPDVADSVRALAARGVVAIRYPGLDQDDLGVWTAPGGDRIAWFFDPDANTLSLSQPAGP